MENLLRTSIKNLKGKIDDVTRSRDYFQRRCAILETILSHEASQISVPGGPIQQEEYFQMYLHHVSTRQAVLSSAASFSEAILGEIESNYSVALPGRRWSLPVVMFCFLVRMMGPKCYEYMRSAMPLPSKTTVLRHFGPAINMWKQCLLDGAGIKPICNLFRRVHQVEGEVDVVVGVDAMAMEVVRHASEGVEEGCNSVFLFRVMPLRCEYKSFCVHLMTRNRGNAGPDVIERINILKACLLEEKIRVKYVATDGDSGYRQLHDDMFDGWWPYYQKKGLDKLLRRLDGTPGLIVGDMLHILKNARARLLGNSITLSIDGSYSFDAQQMNSKLNLGPSLDDKSSKGKMHDNYALSIFNLDNFLKLVESEEWTMAFFILPYALWVTAVTYSKLSVQTRRDCLNFAFEVFAYHLRNISALDTTKVSQNKTPSHVQYCCSRSQCVRTLNSLLIKLLELTNHPDNLAIGRIGTHGLECEFGTVRLLCHNKHTWERISCAFGKLMLFKDLTRIFGRVRIRERLNCAGVKIRASENEKLVYVAPPTTSVSSLYQGVQMMELQKSTQVTGDMKKIADKMRGELGLFTDYLKHLQCQCMENEAGPPRQWDEGPASHNGIVARLVLFQERPGGSGGSQDVAELQEDESVVAEPETLQFVSEQLPSVNI